MRAARWRGRGGWSGHRPLPPRGAGEEALWALPAGHHPETPALRGPGWGAGRLSASLAVRGGGQAWPSGQVLRSWLSPAPPHSPPKHRGCPVGPLDVEMGTLLPRPCPEKLPGQCQSRDFQPCPCSHLLPAPGITRPGSPDFSVLQPLPRALRLAERSPIPLPAPASPLGAPGPGWRGGVGLGARVSDGILSSRSLHPRKA